MLSVQECRKRLGSKAKDLTDENLELVRDQLYILAGLAFTHWKENCSSTKGENNLSPFVGEQPTSTPLPTGELADAK